MISSVEFSHLGGHDQSSPHQRAVAPFALIGVVMALLPSGAPLGFVAILGVLALIGILIRNSVILIVQIEELRKAGRPAWDAVVEATEHRMRPIMLTAAAASLAVIPRTRDFLGAHGLCDDGRHHRRHRADAAVLASALRSVVANQGPLGKAVRRPVSRNAWPRTTSTFQHPPRRPLARRCPTNSG